MLIRQARAILAKLPDDASLMVSLNGVRIDVQKIGFSKNGLNQAAIFLDPAKVDVVINDLLAEKEIDDL